MQSSEKRAIAIVGMGAILPDAPNAPAFWHNIISKKYSISEVPADRWSIADYFDPDPRVPDKTYSKIGGWVRGFEFDWRHFRMPPKVAAAMDQGQQWAVSIAAEALADYGYPERPLNTENTAVILGTAMGGERHYTTHQRVVFPEYAHALEASQEFNRLPSGVREAILNQWHTRIDEIIPEITEDSMPGELPNIVSGRVANMLNLRGPNFITDAACASSFAAVNAAVELLTDHHVDAVLAGGVDRNMGISSFVKFCKIGALSATGSRPFGEGADGFVMGEGSAAFLLKRLEDAEQDGDKIYAVIRGVGGASDGKGKGITAPNPIGQQLAVQRAWDIAGLDPATATLIEAHGTSTRVGDVVEAESLAKIFSAAPRNSIGLGSAKSNIGHLKAGAGAAGLLKAAYALYHKVLPPTLNISQPNPNFDFANSPFKLIQDAREWSMGNGEPRRCGVSAYGFGGTNFHIVIEEHVPGALTGPKTAVPVPVAKPKPAEAMIITTAANHKPAPVRGILAFGAKTPAELQNELEGVVERVEGGWAPPKSLLPHAEVLEAPERLIIDFADHPQLLDRVQKARKVMGFDNPQAWTAVEAQGILRGSGRPLGKIAYLFPGQGSQYVNMGRELLELSPVVAEVFAEADKIMTPILGRPLTDYIFADPQDSRAMMQAEFSLMQTEITQPAMLTLDIAIHKLLAEYGFLPDMVMGHSLGEYAALIAAGSMPFADALEATAARGSEMSSLSLDDNGKMAAVLAPYDVVMDTLVQVDGYVVPANINSSSQCVIGGVSQAVEQACALFEENGYRAIMIPVSHAFHTKIIAPASKPLRQVLDRLNISEPNLPLVANLTGEMYPQSVDGIKDCLQQQVYSPVQWVKGLHTLYDAGVRTFIEVGPKRALRGFARDVFSDKNDVLALITNHPKTGELPTFNQALCGLYAAGFTGNGAARSEPFTIQPSPTTKGQDASGPAVAVEPLASMEKLSQLVTEAVQKALSQVSLGSSAESKVYDRNERPLGSVVISGTGLGLPGAEKQVMDPDNALRILRGEQFVDLIPERFRKQMVEKRITRLVKAADGNGSFSVITDPDQVIKLAGRPGTFDLEAEYGVPQKLVEALDITTQLAMAAGLDALREAGIPLVLTYKQTTTGKYLPDRWLLPEALQDDTGVVFASAFPGGDRFADEFKRYYEWQTRVDQLESLEDLRRYTTDQSTLNELNRRIADLRERQEEAPFHFDRRFLFRILAMGHSQFAQYIGARGPNTHINAACASTAQGVALAEDWIRSGRCRRVIVIGADAVTGDNLMEWVGAGFLAVGAVTTKDRLDEAALPFDRRRHGTILGMGACGLVIESEDAVRERGMRGIVELLCSETANSAFHGTRLDVDHIAMVMNNLVTAAERRFGLNRYALAPHTVFMSHETYTPARGGSASAEIIALRKTFGEAASDIIIANTKGFTGHPMGVGIEDVIAVKILEHGIVPPVPNFKVVDPDLGSLNLSRGGRYPVQYALHLAAGFGSQISMTLTRRIPGSIDRIDQRGQYDRWLASISGYDQAEIEVEKRVLRVKTQGTPPNTPAYNSWQYGTGPKMRALEAADAGGTIQPARMASPEIKPAPQPVKVDVAPPEVTRPAVPQAPSVSFANEPIPPSPLVIETAAATETKPTADPVQKQVLALVAAQTGYPEDMLDLDLDLEADLGIDTVKQAETFVAIREAFDIPARNDLSLREYNTLEKVIRFVKEMRPDLAAAPVQAPETPAPKSEQTPTREIVDTTDADPIASQVIALVAEQTGYPQDMLDLDLDLEADLGIDTVKQAETFVAIREAFDIPSRDDMSLREYNTLEKVIRFVKEMRPDLAAQSAAVSPPSIPPEVQTIQTAPPSTTSPPPAKKPLSNQPQTAVGGDPIAERVLALVAEQTGYPKDMLELDLDLEADLGIDTVKQAETFVALREAFNITRRDDLNLRDYNTLEKVVGFVKDMLPDDGRVSPAKVVATGESAERTPVPHPTSRYRLEDADKMPRRVPVPSLRPSLALCKPTGITLDKNSRVLIMPDQGGVAKALAKRLEKMGVTVLMAAPDLAGEALAAQCAGWLAEGTIKGVYWLPALDVEPLLEEMDLQAWRANTGLRVKNLYTTMRALYDAVSAPGTFLVSGTRLGGLHGYNPEGATAPMGGAVTGFTKAYHVEKDLRTAGHGPLVKAVDLEISRKTAEPADRLIAETLHDPGVVEIGYFQDQRFAITIVEEPAVDGRPGLVLSPDSIFLVTGAAGGITSEIVADLAAASQGIFYLLDLVEAPQRDDPAIQRFRADREALKGELIEQARAAGKRPTPVEIDKEIMAIERHEAALRAIEAVETAGGIAHYRTVNLLDAPAVSAVIDEIRENFGRIDVFIHAGGLLFDRTLPKKEPEQFNLVFDVKADGFFSIMKAAQGLPLGAAVSFSSVAGRFGNIGQSDYSAANDLLCKMTSSMRRWRSETKGIAIDWTAWGEIGMAARGSVPTVMKAMGIDMLPPESGVPTVRRELVAGGFTGEILVGGNLGKLIEERDETGGLDLALANQWLQEKKPDLLMIGAITGCGLYTGLTVETTLDPTEQPFLFDHAPDEGTPWLPGVMATEAMAEIATVLVPVYQVAAVQNEQMLGAFKFFRNQPRTLYLNAIIQPAAGGTLLAKTVLKSITSPARDGLAERVQEHFLAEVVLTQAAMPQGTIEFAIPENAALPVSAGEIYQSFFHGPAYQVLERVGIAGHKIIGQLTAALPPNHHPEEAALLTAPRLVEACFQAAAYWTIASKDGMAFPLGFGAVKLYGQGSELKDRRLYVLVETAEDGASFNGRVIDETGQVIVELVDYRTVSRPGTPA